MIMIQFIAVLLAIGIACGLAIWQDHRIAVKNHYCQQLYSAQQTTNQFFVEHCHIFARYH